MADKDDKGTIPEVVVSSPKDSPPGGRASPPLEEGASARPGDSLPLDEGASARPGAAPPLDEGASARPGAAPPVDEGASARPGASPPVDEGASARPGASPPVDEGASARPGASPPLDEGASARPGASPPLDEGASARPGASPPLDEGASARPGASPPLDEGASARPGASPPLDEGASARPGASPPLDEGASARPGASPPLDEGASARPGASPPLDEGASARPGASPPLDEGASARPGASPPLDEGASARSSVSLPLEEAASSHPSGVESQVSTMPSTPMSAGSEDSVFLHGEEAASQDPCISQPLSRHFSVLSTYSAFSGDTVLTLRELGARDDPTCDEINFARAGRPTDRSLKYIECLYIDGGCAVRYVLDGPSKSGKEKDDWVDLQLPIFEQLDRKLVQYIYAGYLIGNGGKLMLEMNPHYQFVEPEFYERETLININIPMFKDIARRITDDPPFPKNRFCAMWGRVSCYEGGKDIYLQMEPMNVDLIMYILGNTVRGIVSRGFARCVPNPKVKTLYACLDTENGLCFRVIIVRGTEEERQKEMEASKEEASKEEASKEEASKEEASKEEASKEEASKEEASKEEASKEEASKEEASKEEASKEEASKEEASKEEASKEEASKEEASKEEASKEEADINKLVMVKFVDWGQSMLVPVRTLFDLKFVCPAVFRIPYQAKKVRVAWVDRTSMNIESRLRALKLKQKVKITLGVQKEGPVPEVFLFTR